MAKTEHLYADDPRIHFPKLHTSQRKFVYSKFQFVCGGGGYGGGKTWALVMRAILLSIDSEWFGDMTGNEGLLGRDKVLNLQKTTLPELFRLLPPGWIKTYWSKDGKLELRNGSLIHFTHLEATDHLQSYNLGWAGIDQMEQVPREVFECLALERIRRKTLKKYDSKNRLIVPEFDKNGECISTDPDELSAVLDYTTVFGVCNPKKCWAEDMFYDNETYQYSGDPTVRAMYNPEYKYIHIPTRENVAHLAGGYIERQLKNKTAREFMRDVEGSWDTWEGKVYLGCDRNVLLSDNIVPHPAWHLYIGIDHGGTGEDKTKVTGVTAVAFLAYESIYGKYPNVYLFDELYLQGSTIEQTVAEIDNRLRVIYRAQKEFYPEFPLHQPDDRVHIKAWRGDPSMWRRMEDTSETIADRYMYYARLRGMKMPLSPGDNDVAKGVEYVDWMMRKGTFKISPRCKNAFDEYMRLEYGANEKIKVGQRDHMESGIRYGVSALPRGLDRFTMPEVQQTLVQRELEKVRKQRLGQQYGGIFSNAV